MEGGRKIMVRSNKENLEEGGRKEGGRKEGGRRPKQGTS